MADNYLEHRMEDYRAGKLLRRPKGVPSMSRTLPGAAPGPLAATRVLILARSASASPRAAALVELLRSVGCRVAFTDTDTREGNRLAQATGAQCHPVDMADGMALQRSRELIESRWGGIDMEITLREDNPQ